MHLPDGPPSSKYMNLRMFYAMKIINNSLEHHLCSTELFVILLHKTFYEYTSYFAPSHCKYCVK